jgi:hypothetical protein
MRWHPFLECGGGFLSRRPPSRTQAPKLMHSRSLLISLFAGLLTGCAIPGAVAVPTAYPADFVPTVIHLTAVAIGSATQLATLPTEMPSPTPTAVSPTEGPTAAPTPGPRVPLAAIQIRAPGPMSRVVSPLQIQMLAVAGDSRRLEIDLFGEDGRLLGRSLKVVAGSPLGDPLGLKLPFEIRAAGENGFVQVSTRDIRGRTQSLITVPVLLLSSGASQINPAGNTIYERVALSNLPPKADVAGGTLQVDGQILPYNRQPMIMELITDDGRSLSLRILTVSGADWQAFSTTLPFKVDARTPARLYVHEADDVLTGPIYVYSQAITLNP